MDTLNIIDAMNNSNVNDLIVNIAGGLIVAIILGLLAVIQKNKLNFRRLRIMVSLAFSKENIAIYTNKKILKKFFGEVDDYILSTEQELIYIGYSFSSIKYSKSEINSSLREVVKTNKLFKAYLINPDNTSLMEFYSSFLNKSIADLKYDILQSVNAIQSIRNGLDEHNRNNIKVYYHNSFIQASSFIFKNNEAVTKIMLDHKIYTENDKCFYGLEFTKNATKIFPAIISFYKRVVDNAIEVELINTPTDANQ